MIISLIAAASENNVIGKNNTLPWRLPADMKFFRDKTMGHCVVTGRKNYESIPDAFRPLPGRTNIIVTRNRELYINGALVVHSLQDAVKEAEQRGESELFIIGGGEIFRQALMMAQTIYLTRIHHHFDGDIFFPELNSDEWEITERRDCKKDEKNPYDYSFLTLKRAK